MDVLRRKQFLCIAQDKQSTLKWIELDTFFVKKGFVVFCQTRGGRGKNAIFNKALVCSKNLYFVFFSLCNTLRYNYIPTCIAYST